MDEIWEDEILMESDTPLSARRIKKITMAQVKTKRIATLRWLTRVAVVAAVIVALGVTALAAGAAMDGEKLIEYVDRIFGKEMTDKQVEVATEIGKTYDKSLCSSNGTTITPIAAVADDLMLYLYIHVEAPENVVLPDCAEGEYYGIYAGDGSFTFGPTIHVDGSDREHTVALAHKDVSPLPDEDPTDNVKDFVIRMICHGNVKFNDGMPKYLKFGSLWFHDTEHEMWPSHKDTTGRCSRICWGNFTVDIDCGYKDAVLEVDTGAVTYYDEEYDFTTVIKKITITPLHIEVECTRTACDEKYIFPRGGPVQLVMKDGTVVQVLDAYFDAAAQNEFHPDSVAGVLTFDWFDELIVLEDIDYILVGDGEKFDVN